MRIKLSEHKGKKVINEKDLERQMIDLLSQPNQNPAGATAAISAFMLFRAAKRLQRYSIFLLIVTIVLAGSILLLGVVLAYYIGLIP
jgi:hypothetical protein